MYRERTYTPEGWFVTEFELTLEEAIEVINNLHLTRVCETPEGVLIETNVFCRFYKKLD